MMLSFQMTVDLDFTMILGCYVCGVAHKKLQILHFFKPTFTNSMSVLVWACIGPNHVGSLVICQRSVNAEYYIEILQDNLFQSVSKIYGDRNCPFIFQQDNATCHSANFTKAFFSLRGIVVLPWPSQSPDLNVIENV